MTQISKKTSTGSGSVSIGSSIGGSTHKSVLFIDSSLQLAEDNADLNYDDTNKILHSKNFNLPTTASSTEGVINQNGSAFIHTAGTSNFFVGNNAGNFTSTGIGGNVALGFAVLSNLVDGYWNMGLGYYALNSPTSGSSNVGIGAEAGRRITTGSNNVAMGRGALDSCSTGSSNMGIGLFALQSITTTGNNVAIGTLALSLCNTYNNIGIGYKAQALGTSGQNNVSIGTEAAAGLTTGAQNVNIGSQALQNQQTGSNNVGIGHQAGRGASARSISGGVFIGYQAGYNETNSNRLYIDNSNTTTPLIYGEFDNDIIEINGRHFINDGSGYKRETLRYALAVG